MTSRHRLSQEMRRTVILTAAVRVANSDGMMAVNHGTVSRRCTVATTTSTVRHYFPTREDLLRAVAADEEANETVRSVARDLGLSE